MIACVVTALWATAIAYYTKHGMPVTLPSSLLEIARNAAWSAFLLGLLSPAKQTCLSTGFRVHRQTATYAGVYVLLISATFLSYFDAGMAGGIAGTLSGSLGHLGMAVMGMLLITALLIFLEDRGPVFYRQERVGKDGYPFMVLKFRSMRADAERCGTPQWATANDPRTTRVGRIIRLLRIDEFPQILNVLKGDMSFVGPRPERPYFVEQLCKEVPYYNIRHSVKPGITGMAQVRYQYGASVDDAVQKLQYDLYYVINNSLFLDLLILIDTLQVVILGKGSR
jgi:lipopolysaccharide/colanic/teichoic acid biosynthesis glycosyltransferase